VLPVAQFRQKQVPQGPFDFCHQGPKGQEIIEVLEIIELACEVLHGLQLLQQWMFLKASSPKTDV